MEKQTPIFDIVFTKFKNDFPQDWRQYVRKATRNIKAIQKLHGLDNSAQGTREAVSHCLRVTDGPATAATYLVAAGILTRLHDLESEHIATELRALKIETQQEKLGISRSFSESDKATINAYYTHCLAKVTAITDRIMQEAIALTLSLGIEEPKPEPLNMLPTYPRHHGPHWGRRGGAVSA